jgi:DNA-binding beta-propeller fold protein YncE
MIAMRIREWRPAGAGASLAILAVLLAALLALAGCSGASAPGAAALTAAAGPVPGPQAAGYHLVRSWAVPHPIGLPGIALGLAVRASDNHVFVVAGSPGNPHVMEFTNTGGFIKQWGTQGSAPGDFYDPQWLALGPGGHYLYVGDGGTAANTRIEKFTTGGTFVQEWGSQGTAPGQFSVLGGLAVGPHGDCVYAVDTNNHRVEKFTNQGVLIKTWGKQGTTPSLFQYPTGLAVNASGDVYVADSHNYRVQEFTSNGVFLTKWDSFSQSLAGVVEGVAVGSAGNVFVEDGGDNLIKEFTSAGAPLTSWAASAFGLAVASHGDVYATAGGQVWVYAT